MSGVYPKTKEGWEKRRQFASAMALGKGHRNREEDDIEPISVNSYVGEIFFTEELTTWTHRQERCSCGCHWGIHNARSSWCRRCGRASKEAA